ncbi:MAG: hypothetical protein Q4E36_05090 [Bacillota bacterium]|nr:hypothetical protein [Bacillota bacterium]
MKIYQGKHYNKDVYILENDQIHVKVLKDFGAKIVSIYKKDQDFELLFQASDKTYKDPNLGDNFEDYDRSGIDDMLPTIDSCLYPNSYKRLNDHGDLWAQKWDYEIKEDSLLCKVRCDSLKLDLYREIFLEEDQVRLAYKLKNLTQQDHYYLWAFHGLMNFNDSTVLDFGNAGQIINVIDGQAYDFDYRNLGAYPDKKSYKFYFQDPVEKGQVDVYYGQENVHLQMNFDTKINKYLGVWLTKGGLKGEYNFAIEPSSAYYDSLEKAYENHKVSQIASKEEKTWTLNLKLMKGNK